MTDDSVHGWPINACSVREVSTGLKLILPNPWETRGLVEPQLFDVSGDPSERVNLIEARPEDARRLMTRLAQWRERHPTVDTMSTPMDPEQAAALKALGYTEQDIGR